MKIFIAVGCLTGGGAERVAAMLANGFSAKGHQVIVAADLGMPVTYKLNPNVKLLPLCPITSNKIIKWGGALLYMRRYIKELKPDINIGFELTCSSVLKIGSIGRKIPTVMTEHYAFEFVKSEANNLFRKYPKIRCFFDNLFTYTTVLTTPDYLIAKKYLRHVEVMPNPCSFSRASVLPKKENILLAVGRIFDWHYKGFDILIKSWAKIAHLHPDWILQIAGNGNKEDFQVLQKLVDQYGLSKQVKFLGFQKDMLKVYRRASIFVLSSRSEGLPMVLIEAMSQGCAPVATDFKGRTKEVISSEKVGLICSPEDPKALAQGIENMISDEKYRNEVQKKAIERSELFSLERIVARWENFISEKILFNK